MEKEVLRSITGIEIFPVISLIIFIVFFLLVLGWILTLNEKYITEMENIPLEDNNNANRHISTGGVK